MVSIFWVKRGQRGFSSVTDLFTKKRNLLEIVKKEDLWFIFKNIEPNIKKLTKNHQIQLPY